MNSPFQAKTASKPTRGGGVNPFAKALMETEKSSVGDNQNQTKDANSLLSQALSKTGGQFPSPDTNGQQPDPAALLEQQRLAEEKAKKARERKKLHDQINPIDKHEVFSAEQKRVEKQINDIRQELKFLIKESKELEMEFMQAGPQVLHQAVVNPGTKGTYYFNFFEKLKALIMLLRKKVRSARTWMKQMNSKKKKKKKGPRIDTGLKVGGNKAEQGRTVHDMMHHENNAVYGG